MDALEQYIRDHTSPEEELLHELDRETNLRVIQPRMLSGHIQGRLLEMLVGCGVKSGRDVDKFAACGLHSAPGSVLTDCPILEESPVNLECKVTQVIPLGSHDLFLTEVVACDVDESLLDENGKLCLEKAKLIVYSHGDYLALGKKLGTFGYSVRKKKPVRRKK